MTQTYTSTENPLSDLFSGYLHQDAVLQGQDTLDDHEEIKRYAEEYLKDDFDQASSKGSEAAKEIALFAQIALFIVDRRDFHQKNPVEQIAVLTAIHEQFANLLGDLPETDHTSEYDDQFRQLTESQSPAPKRRTINATCQLLTTLGSTHPTP